ncbi:hypothetical protein ScPMuIL_016339 [Solemya velum]
MLRTISFIERVEIDFNGSIFNQAMVLGDLDNDKDCELAVGSIEGDLCVFKGSSQVAWKKWSDLGMITCVGIGDICGTGKNHLVCLTAEGWCYIFDIKADSTVTEGVSGKVAEDDSDKLMMPAFNQHLPANGKCMLIADVDGEGHTELVVGYSDRVVRSFRWHTGPETDGDTHGRLVQTEKWQLAEQIGSMTMNFCEGGKPLLLVSQPGGTYAKLYYSAQSPTDNDVHTDVSEDSIHPHLCYDHLGASRAHNKTISTEIIGGIQRNGQLNIKNGTFYALCTVDGTLVLVQNGGILWSLLVDHQLFSLTKLDVTGNGSEEVVCCSWDGQTYIVNHSRDVVRYQFEENVAGFLAGSYAVTPHENVPCFVYATFNNRIYIYYNIHLPQVESTNLIEVMNREQETHELLARLNISAAEPSQLKQLYHWCLYGQHGNNSTVK